MFTVICDNFKNLGGFIGTFTPIPIIPSAYPASYHFTHHIKIRSILCTTLIHNITKLGYYSRNIPDIGNICHQIPGMFQLRNQYQVKTIYVSISVPSIITQLQRSVAWVY